MKHYSEIIIIDPTIRFGKPTIKGTRISVYDVLSLFASGMSLQEVIDDFPELGVEEINAVFAYAADREQKLLNAS
jgi:uncharacterized protein (DUF433 family)